jgi:signal transduction histidine kinase
MQLETHLSGKLWQMKKINLLLFILLCTGQALMAQINWGDYSHSYLDKTLESNNSIGIITAIKRINDSYWDDSDGMLQFAAFAKDTTFLKARPRDFLIRSTFDTSKVHIFLHGVTKKNGSNYEFSVSEYKGKVLTPFTAINRFTDKALQQQAVLPQMAYLGGLLPKIGQTLVVDVREKGTSKILETVAIKRRALRPYIQNVQTAGNKKTFMSLSLPQKSKLSLKLPSTYNSLIFQLENNPATGSEYQLSRSGKILINWRRNDVSKNLISLNELKKGSYTLAIRYPIQPENITSLNFEIEPVWYQTNLFQIIASILLAGCGGAVIFLTLYLRQKRKTEWAQLNKTKAQLELKSIYAQLNPHFIFNAISSIQGLINKQDIAGANQYLTDFAQLMREAIINTDKEVISLHEKLRNLNTYLRLEQLRFNFKYEIKVEESIDTYITEVPTLLLQPLVENAVKHGVSGLDTQGHINISFTKIGNDMLVRLKDNGKGFTDKHASTGYGLKLTRDRITLLNTLSNDQNICLEIKNQAPSGTTIEIKFSNWFL